MAATHATAPALSAQKLSKHFGARVAYEDVTFDVRRGEIFGFLGPNGAGKTTMVRTFGTLVAPTSGTATVAGLSLAPKNDLEIRRRIAIMPEVPGLYLKLSVEDNLQCFADLYEVSNAADRIDQALVAVHLRDRAGDTCGSLSKGLRQRVALARTLLSDPEVLFLDEPTSGLDPSAARDVLDLIGDLRNRGVTVFLTTHRLDEAERVCDRVAILSTRLRTIGLPGELGQRVFTKAVRVRTRQPLSDPAATFAGVPGLHEWRDEGNATYLLAVADPAAAAPEVTRALVACGADVLALGEAQHSLQDVYLQMVGPDGVGADGANADADGANADADGANADADGANAGADGANAGTDQREARR